MRKIRPTRRGNPPPPRAGLPTFRCRCRRAQFFRLSLLFLVLLCAALGSAEFARATPTGHLVGWFALFPASLFVWHFFPREWNRRDTLITLLGVSAVARWLVFGYPPSADSGRYLQAAVELAAELAAVALLVLLLRRRGLPDRNVLLYALNPLTLLAFPAEGPYAYLAWLLVLVPFAPRLSWIVLSGTIGFFLLVSANHFHLGNWLLPTWTLWGIWGPSLGLWLWENRHLRGRTSPRRPLGESEATWSTTQARPTSSPSAGDVAIIIPTLNEGPQIEACLDAVQRLRDPTPAVVIADGGSTDETLAIARRRGVRIVSSPPGRGTQIAAAVRDSSADIILVLHADATVEPDAVQRIHRALTANPRAAGGAVGMRFSTDGFGLSVTEFLNECRGAFGGASFGDQGQFFRRRLLEKTGGFPEQPLFEDVELSLRIRRSGSWLYLGGGVLASARRWIREGWTRRFFNVLRLYFIYSITPSAKRAASAARHYETYYSNDKRALTTAQPEVGPFRQNKSEAPARFSGKID